MFDMQLQPIRILTECLNWFNIVDLFPKKMFLNIRGIKNALSADTVLTYNQWKMHVLQINKTISSLKMAKQHEIHLMHVYKCAYSLSKYKKYTFN